MQATTGVLGSQIVGKILRFIPGRARLKHLGTETTSMRPERHVIDRQDDELVAELFRKHGEALTRQLRDILGNTALAEDVAQDAYSRLCSVDIRTLDNPRAYLFQVGTRFALMYLRRHKIEARDRMLRSPIEDDPGRLAGPETHASFEESIAHLEAQIGLLSPALREVFVMRYGQGMEPSEIIRQLGISAAAYEDRLTAAKRLLRQRLRALGVDPQAP